MKIFCLRKKCIHQLFYFPITSYSFTIRFQWSCTSLIFVIIQWQMINARNWLASIFLNNCSKLGQFIFHFTFNWWKRPALALTGPCLCCALRAKIHLPNNVLKILLLHPLDNLDLFQMRHSIRAISFSIITSAVYSLQCSGP